MFKPLSRSPPVGGSLHRLRRAGPLFHNPAMSRFVTPDRFFVWTGVLLAFVFAIGIAYGLGIKSARTQCVTEGKFYHNDQIYRCERLR